MKKAPILLILLVAFMHGCNVATASDAEVDDFIKAWNDYKNSGDITITFKSDGTADTVTCNTKKYSAELCEHLGEHIFDYYQKHKKG